MKLIVNNEEFQADKIIKTGTDIIGQDLKGNEIFTFRGISNFIGFQLKDDNGNAIEFGLQPKTEIQLLQEKFDDLENKYNALQGALLQKGTITETDIIPVEEIIPK